MYWFYPQELSQYTRRGCIIWWGWFHTLFSLFRVSMLAYTHFDTSRLQIASSIKYHRLWCQARALPLFVPHMCIMSVIYLICHFAVIQQHLVSRFLCHLITSLWSSWFLTGIFAVSHATLDTEYLISHTRSATVDTIAVSEVHELLGFIRFSRVLCTNRLVIFWLIS